jgi:hypothetical protein
MTYIVEYSTAGRRVEHRRMYGCLSALDARAEFSKQLPAAIVFRVYLLDCDMLTFPANLPYAGCRRTSETDRAQRSA